MPIDDSKAQGPAATAGYALVLAGGSGTRLWPYSRRDHPKQLLPLVGEVSMLELTLDRLAPLVPPENCYVLTGREYAAEVRERLPAVPPHQVVGEPSALGTAAAIGLGAALVAARDPGGRICVVTADHVIEPAAIFRSALATALEVAGRGYLVTFGIQPTRPETGFGYVELGAPIDEFDGAARSVARFVEKPDLQTAERYLASGRHVWNSGMFAFDVPTILAAYRAHLPLLADRLEEIRRAAESISDPTSGSLEGAFEARLSEIWSRITDRTTIDYGIMERAERVACVPADFGWQDIGAWPALREARGQDAEGNTIVGEHLGIDTRNSLVFSSTDRLVATIGLEDMAVIDTGDVLLVCPLSRAQEVKALVEALKARGDGRI